MNSRKCDICNVDVHRASYLKHLRSKKHLENMKQIEMIIPEWLFQEPIENKIKKLYSPKSLKQLARDTINYIKNWLGRWLIHITLLTEHYKLDSKLIWIVIISIMQILN